MEYIENNGRVGVPRPGPYSYTFIFQMHIQYFV